MRSQATLKSARSMLRMSAHLLCKMIIDVGRLVGILHSQGMLAPVSDAAVPRSCPSTGAKLVTRMQSLSKRTRLVVILTFSA